MNEYILYNFDHGFKTAKNFKIGQYLIEVSDDQAKNLNELEQNATRSFTLDENLQPKVETTDYKIGKITETATLKVKKTELQPSIIYKEQPERNLIDDFIVFLSFITGRRVYLEHELKQNLSTNYFDSVVSKHFFHFPKVDLIDGFKNLDHLKLTTQFYNLVYANTLKDLPSISFYANTIINALYDKWSKSNKVSTYSGKKINTEKIKDYLKFQLNKKIAAKIQILVRSFLVNESRESDVVSDIVARINISDQPSAMYKFQKFLIGLNLIPENSDKEILDRVQRINKVRNMIMHAGDIISDKKLDYDQRLSITGNITFIIIGIVEYYFAKEIFKIDNYHVEQNAEEIRKYFNSGIFRGQKVFKETYEQFIDRQNYEWIENGTYI